MGDIPANPQNQKQTSDPQGTRHSGLGGLFERALRRFKTGVSILTLLPLYMLASGVLGTALTPAVLLVSHVWDASSSFAPLARYAALAFALATGYFVYGFTLLFVAPLVNFVLRARPHAWRGPYYSLETLKWFVHNGMTYLMRYTFLPFIVPTPYANLFFKLMGMKIGEGTLINSENISDPALITLGKRVTIGGSATIIAHYGVGGYLIMSPVRILDGATIGLRATIMAGVEIGAGARVMPNSVVLPNTKIPANETWGGVPARKIETREGAKPAAQTAMPAPARTTRSRAEKASRTRPARKKSIA